MAAEAEQSLGTRTMRGMMWAYGTYVGGRSIVLVSTAILAHLLTPADFGVVAIALVFMTFMETVQDLGLTQALIVSSPEEEPARAQTTFGWTVLIGAVLALAVSGLGQVVAGFFGHQSLRAIIPVLGLSFFVESLGNTHDSIARKHLDYRVRAYAQGADVLTRGATGIALALAGFGAWALVLGYLVGTVGRTVTLWARVPFRPRLRFTREHLGSLVRFGGVLTLVDVGSAFARNLDYLFIGRVLGATSLGLYTIGYRLPELLIMNVSVVAADVLFPAYSALRRESREEGFLLSLRFLAAVVFPIGVGLAVLAHPFVLDVFGHRWYHSIEVTQILVIYAVFSTLNIPAGTIYKVSGRAWILLAVQGPYLAALVVSLLLFAHEGIVAVAICMTAVQAAGALAAVAIAGRMLDVRYRRIAATMRAPVLASAGMAALVIPVALLVDAQWPELLLGASLGAVAYAALLWFLAPDIPQRLLGVARLRIPRKARVEQPAPLAGDR
jgi:PST family polysaccharide transporter